MTEAEREERRGKIRECFATIRGMLDRMEAECLGCGGYVQVEYSRPEIESSRPDDGGVGRALAGPDVYLNVHATVLAEMPRRWAVPPFGEKPPAR